MVIWYLNVGLLYVRWAYMIDVILMMPPTLTEPNSQALSQRDKKIRQNSIYMDYITGQFRILTLFK